MSSISFKGIVAGALFDGVMSVLYGFALTIGYAAWSGISAPEDLHRIAEAGDFLALAFAGGGFISIVAGYLAALIAGRAELLNGALASVLCVAISFGLFLLMPHEMSGGELAQYLLAPVFGLIGGYLRLRQVQARS